MTEDWWQEGGSNDQEFVCRQNRARLRHFAATARHPSRGLPSRSSRFGRYKRERRMVAQIFPRWNRVEDWLKEAEGYSRAA
jgi:hypothetical protein